MGENNPFYGKSHSTESIQKIKDNMPDMSGEKNPFYGRHHSDYTRYKISEVNKGRKLDPDVIKYRGLPVRCVEMNIVFDSATHAARYFGIERYSVIKDIKDAAKCGVSGEYKNVLGYTWEYVLSKS